MAKEIDPQVTTRAAAYELWMKAPNPMVTFFKTLDVTNLVRISKKKQMKFNMLLDFCIGRAAASIKEFYILPVGTEMHKHLMMLYTAYAIPFEFDSCYAVFPCWKHLSWGKVSDNREGKA